ncbi:uncharacterized protein LOC110024120 [Phalaenopsis equestris]|uniref:uncharacterized protein LOC110024120 n=1 Tax=Phalaenopsis equestris TaxID=78828 RepID=UPI0009E31918|nr:uncharacterized protein LOC110024120 [Phalaenopsis equestris]
MPSFLFSPSPTTAALLLLLLFFSLSLPIPLSSHRNLLHRRNLHSSNTEEDPNDSPIPKSKPPPKNKPISQLPEAKNKTKPLKSNTANSSSSSSSILTKILSSATTSPTKSKLKKTANQLNKTISNTKKNTTKSNSTKTGQINYLKPLPSKSQSIPKLKPQTSPADLLDDTDITTTGSDDDLISDFRDLPSRLHSAILPDLEKLSATSKHYLSKTHRDITAGVKPFVGNRYAPSIAYAASSAVLLLPLFLLAAVFRHLLRCASLHRSLLFVQAYLAIYFTTLSLTALVTGLEPLWFFYAASPNAYAWTQAVQTFGYLVYLGAQGIGLRAGGRSSSGELEGARDLRGVLHCDLWVGPGRAPEEGLFLWGGRGR